MNIFKVMASAPRSKFNENFTSAIMAWLLNPYMDHGIGYVFLHRFLAKINVEQEIISKLNNTITDDNDNSAVEVFLEHFVDNARIDIVVKIDNNYYICIENKIYSQSAKDRNQLVKQYDGIKEEMKDNDKASLKTVFLIPNMDATTVMKEILALENERGKTPEKIVWKDISEIINGILKDEQDCKISPINEYTKHTLKAFSVFINEGFSGYNTIKPVSSNKPKNADLGKLTYAEICKRDDVLYVGIQRGVYTLYRLDIEELRNNKFWCSSLNEIHQQWITKQRFIDVVSKRINEDSQT